MGDLTDEELKIYASAQRPAGWVGREMASELLDHRATMKRLEEWAVNMDVANHPVRSSADVAAELRNRIKGG